MVADGIRKASYGTALCLMLGLLWALASDQAEADRFARTLSRPNPQLLSAAVRATDPETDPTEAAALAAYVQDAFAIPKPSFYLTSLSTLLSANG
jgi:hypothetical protein